jgi:hypothetical protein
MKNVYFNVGFRNDQYKCTMNIEKKEKLMELDLLNIGLSPKFSTNMPFTF